MKAGQILKALRLMSTLEEDIPIGTVMAFLYLMDNPGATASQVMTVTGLGKSRVGRNLAILTARARPGKAGVDVCYFELDPSDHRVKRWYLNEHGNELAKQIRALIEDC